ncbi:MAG: GAK system ATP-grasp enzyme [Deltaproteobacteria bacterium]|nr:GAK system ATP-grasp enzyme [Deltaproteobacteria bacterium]
MPQIAVIGNYGGWSSEHLADCVARATGKRLLVDMENVRLDLEREKVWYEGMDLTRLDAVIIKKIGPHYSPHLLDRLEILRFLENSGVRIFSRPLSIMRVLDRLGCTVTLRMAGIPMPPTAITENTEQAVKIIEEYEDAVLKPLYSSKARGMWVLQYGRDTYISVEDFKRNNPILYIQKKMNLRGMDLGIVFLGGEYVTTYARCSDAISWNTSTETGGRYVAHDPLPESIEIARKAQALFDLDFATVDVVETPDGPLVFEVTAFGGFKGMETARNMDGARCYVDYVLKRIAT